MVIFEHPHGGPLTVQIALKNPEFNDGTSIKTGAKFEEAMDGTLWGKKDPVTKHFSLSFIDLSRKKVLELRDFLIYTKGNLKTAYFDYNGNPWIGKITDEKWTLTTTGTGPGGDGYRRESNSVTLTFEVQ